MGRPTKLTPELKTAIVEAIEGGNYFATACELAGVSVATGYDWLARGEGRGNRCQKPEFAEFAEAIKKATAKAEVEAIGRLRDAAKGGQVITRKTTTRKDGSEVVEESFTYPAWQADAWFLERRLPNKWGKQDRPTPAIDFSKLTDEQLQRIAAGEDPTIVIATTSNSGNGTQAAEYVN